ncbi:hypothetical protein [Magnetospira thiophila]
MSDDLGSDFDQFLPDRGQKPVLMRWHASLLRLKTVAMSRPNAHTIPEKQNGSGEAA